jgi:hypothetical protein
VACRVLNFSTAAFYEWRKAPVSQRDWDDAHVTNAALDAHRGDPGFRLQVHRRRTRRARVHRKREPGLAAVLPAGDLVGAFEEAGP